MDSHPHLTAPARAELGDLAGFGRMYRRTAGLVRSVLPRLGVQRAAVDDATQDVFVVAYRRRAEFDGARPIEPWLVGIARRVAFRYRRSAARGQRKLAALQGEPTPAHAESQAARLEAYRFLERFLGELREERREVFVLGELRGLTGPEIASRLRIPVDTVYTRLRAARRQLEATLLRADEADPPPSNAELRRCWSLLVPQLGPGPAGGLLLGLGKLKLALAGVAVATAAAVVASSEPPPASVAAPTPVAAPAEPAPVVVAPLVPPPASRFEALLTARPVVRAARPAPVDAIGADLLASAVAALAGGDPDLALARLDRHAREFPGSPLADARALTRVRALCRVGDVAGARREAASLDPGGLTDEALAGTCVAGP